MSCISGTAALQTPMTHPQARQVTRQDTTSLVRLCTHFPVRHACQTTLGCKARHTESLGQCIQETSVNQCHAVLRPAHVPRGTNATVCPSERVGVSQLPQASHTHAYRPGPIDCYIPQCESWRRRSASSYSCVAPSYAVCVSVSVTVSVAVHGVVECGFCQALRFNWSCCAHGRTG